MASVLYEKHEDYFDKRILLFVPAAVIVKIVLMLVLPEDGFLLPAAILSSLAFGVVLCLGVVTYAVMNERATMKVAVRNVHRLEEAYGVSLPLYDEDSGEPEAAEFAVYRATKDVGSEQRVVGVIPATSSSGLVRFVGVIVASDEKLTLSVRTRLPEYHGESALSSRIDSGLADPISDREKALVTEMTEDFNSKYGRDPAGS